MQIERKRKSTCVVLVFGWLGFGCSVSKTESPPIDEASVERSVTPGWAASRPRASDEKSGVIQTTLSMDDAPRPESGFRPEVLIVTVETFNSDGDLVIPVTKFEDKLPLDRCKSAPKACERLHERFGQQWAIGDHHHCTGTFVSANEVVTAEHCLKYTDWEKTYAIMGFYADHKWEVEDGLMTVPASNAVRLCHVKACEKSTDFALVHVCLNPARHSMPGLRSLASTRNPSPRGLAVYSYAWGLPLKRYEAVIDLESKAPLFTNAEGGSGAAVVNADGQVVGIVGGTARPFRTAVCPQDSSDCQGEPLASHADIARIIARELTCEALRSVSEMHTQECPQGTIDDEE